MTAFTDRFDDALEPLGVATGAFLVLVGLGSAVGALTGGTAGPVVTAITVLGALATLAVGAGLAALSWTGER